MHLNKCQEFLYWFTLSAGSQKIVFPTNAGKFILYFCFVFVQGNWNREWVGVKYLDSFQYFCYQRWGSFMVKKYQGSCTVPAEGGVRLGGYQVGCSFQFYEYNWLSLNFLWHSHVPSPFSVDQIYNSSFPLTVDKRFRPRVLNPWSSISLRPGN